MVTPRMKPSRQPPAPSAITSTSNLSNPHPLLPPPATQKGSSDSPPAPSTRQTRAKAVGPTTSGTVTAAGLSTWKRGPKGGSGDDGSKQSLGMGMKATPARKKKSSSATKGSIGLHSTPRAKVSRRAQSSPSKATDDPSDLTSSSLPLASLEDPSDTNFFAPPAPDVPADEPIPSPSTKAIGPAHSFDLTTRQDQSRSKGRVSSAAGTKKEDTIQKDDSVFPQHEDLTVPVNFPSSSAPTSEDAPLVHPQITHEDFTVPLNDSTRASQPTARSSATPSHPRVSRPAAGPSSPSLSNVTPRPKSKSTKPHGASDTCSRGKTPMVSKVKSDWMPKGGSSVHTRQSTPYRHPKNVEENIDTTASTNDPTEQTISELIAPRPRQQSLKNSSASRDGPNAGNETKHSDSLSDERSSSARRHPSSTHPLSSRDSNGNGPTVQNGPSSSNEPPVPSLRSPASPSDNNEHLLGDNTNDNALSEDLDVEIGRLKSRRQEETLIFAPGDVSDMDDQVDLNDLDLDPPPLRYSNDDASEHSPPPEPERFLPSSQVDLQHPYHDPGSPISFSPSPSPESHIITPSIGGRKRNYVYSQSVVDTPAKSSTVNGKKSRWRGAAVLARMDGEAEVEEEPRATVRRRATRARKTTDVEEEAEEEDSTDHGKRPRKSYKQGGIVLEGEAEAARKKRIEHYQHLEDNYELRIEYVRILRR